MSQQGLLSAIGKRVLAARRAANWTRQQLSAEAAVSERYLAQLEKGEANVSLAVLLRVTEALAIDCQALFAPLLDEPAGRVAGTTPDQRIATLLRTLSASEIDQAYEVLKQFVESERQALCGVALVGLRGAGKTTLGERVARRLNLPFVQLTKLIEKRAGMGVEEIFSLGGQDAFRRQEREAVAQLIETGEFALVETAGGIVENGDAYELVLARFRTIWLRASPEEHMDRVINQGDFRPMAGHDQAMTHLRSLLVAREPQHARANDVLDTSRRDIENCVGELARLIEPITTSERTDRLPKGDEATVA